MTTTYMTQSVNENGAMLQAWANDAEFSLGEGNGAEIEIRAIDSIHGRTQTFEISSMGVDSFEQTINE